MYAVEQKLHRHEWGKLILYESVNS